MITGREIREARQLVRWSLQQLALAARLPLNTVMRAELLDRQPVGTVVHAIAIREALEAAGIEFGEAGGAAPEGRAMTVVSVRVTGSLRTKAGRKCRNAYQH